MIEFLSIFFTSINLVVVQYKACPQYFAHETNEIYIL